MARQAGRAAQAVHGEPLCLLRAASHWPHPRARGPAFTLAQRSRASFSDNSDCQFTPQVPDTCFRPAPLLAAAPRALYVPRLPRAVETSSCARRWCCCWRQQCWPPSPSPPSGRVSGTDGAWAGAGAPRAVPLSASRVAVTGVRPVKQPNSTSLRLPRSSAGSRPSRRSRGRWCRRWRPNPHKRPSSPCCRPHRPPHAAGKCLEEGRCVVVLGAMPAT